MVPCEIGSQAVQLKGSDAISIVSRTPFFPQFSSWTKGLKPRGIEGAFALRGVFEERRNLIELLSGTILAIRVTAYGEDKLFIIASCRNMVESVYSMPPIIVHTSSIRYGRYLQSLVGQLGLEARLDASGNFVAGREHNIPVGLVIVDCEKWSEWLSQVLREHGVMAIYLSNGSGPVAKTRDEEIVLRKPLRPREFISSVKKLYAPLLKESPDTLAEPYLIGNSSKIKEVRNDIKKISNTDMTVLLLGETGTGKGVLAHALHNNSWRSKNAFVEVNCANIPQSLMESEFFGYKKGAFTGAWSDKQGKFELASGGTIFLDEISEMSWSMQAKLLQVLQESEFVPIGGANNVRVNVRIIAATNADLFHNENVYKFRLDLYYRLSVIRLLLPAIKERKEDIIPLTIHFLEKYAHQYNKPVTYPSSKLWDMLEEHDWPGNVRELENTIKTLVAMESESLVYDDLTKRSGKTGSRFIDCGDSESRLASVDINSKTLREITEREIAIAEKNIISEALSKTNGNKKKTAEILQASYKSILNKIKMYGL